MNNSSFDTKSKCDCFYIRHCILWIKLAKHFPLECASRGQQAKDIYTFRRLSAAKILFEWKNFGNQKTWKSVFGSHRNQLICCFDDTDHQPFKRHSGRRKCVSSIWVVDWKLSPETCAEKELRGVPTKASGHEQNGLTTLRRHLVHSAPRTCPRASPEVPKMLEMFTPIHGRNSRKLLCGAKNKFLIWRLRTRSDSSVLHYRRHEPQGSSKQVHRNLPGHQQPSHLQPRLWQLRRRDRPQLDNRKLVRP